MAYGQNVPCCDPLNKFIQSFLMQIKNHCKTFQTPFETSKSFSPLPSWHENHGLHIEKPLDSIFAGKCEGFEV